MFRCQLTGKLSKPNEKGVKIVTKTRQKTYTNVLKRGEREITITSEGYEIVEEKLVLASVAAKLNKGNENVKQQPKANVRSTSINDNRKSDKTRDRGNLEKTGKKQF